MPDTFNLRYKMSNLLAPPYDPTAQPIDYLNYYEANNLEAIYLFNKEYNEYVSNCVSQNTGFVPASNCSSLLTKLQADAGDIYTAATKTSAIFQTFNELKTSNPSLYSVIPSEYKSQPTQYSNIMKKYDKVTETRDDLDQKLRELYDIPGSKSLDYKYNYDSTMYSGILITIVASAVIYITFTKL